MASFADYLTDILSTAFQAEGLSPHFGRVTLSGRPDLAQFQCNGALAAAKDAKQAPRAIAERILDRIKDHPALTHLSIAGPGFINIDLTDRAICDFLNDWLTKEKLGIEAPKHRQTILLDYGGANIAKAMHVGHLRAAIIGDSLRRIFSYLGHEAFGDVHLGDWGLPMGMVISEIKRRQPDLPYFISNFKGPYPVSSPVTMDDLEILYPEAASACKEDPERLEEARKATAELQDGNPGYRALWQHFFDTSIAALKRDYGALNVQFDLWKGEAHVHDLIDPMIRRMQEQGLVEQSDGALIVRVAEETDKKEMPPLILRKKDGAVMYGTTDLATIIDRVETQNPDLILYVVDQRQHLHFEQVFRAAHKAGIDGKAKLEHLGFGTMNGTDGKPFKTRSGGVLKLQDLIATMTNAANARLIEHGLGSSYTDEERENIAQKVGLAALKFADLSNYPVANYVFDLDRFLRFEGRTGPYLLYACVRIKSLLRKAGEQGEHPNDGTLLPPQAVEERELMLILGRVNDAVEIAALERAPNKIADYAFDLAQAFSKFYAACHILGEEDRKIRHARLALADLTQRTLVQMLDLLGIESPERM